MNMHEVRGWDMKLESKCNWKSHMPLKWLLTSCLPIVTSSQHVVTNFKLFWFSLTWCNCIFARLKNKATKWLLIVNTSDFATGEDKMWIYLIKRECWPNTSCFVIYSHFRTIHFGTPCKRALEHDKQATTVTLPAQRGRVLYFISFFLLSSSFFFFLLSVNMPISQTP